MDEKDTLKNELIESIRNQNNTGRIRIDKHEALIISVAIVALSGGLISGKLSEVAYVGLIGSFFGYTFARIFNHVQGKE